MGVGEKGILCVVIPWLTNKKFDSCLGLNLQTIPSPIKPSLQTQVNRWSPDTTQVASSEQIPGSCLQETMETQLYPSPEYPWNKILFY